MILLDARRGDIERAPPLDRPSDFNTLHNELLRDTFPDDPGQQH